MSGHNSAPLRWEDSKRIAKFQAWQLWRRAHKRGVRVDIEDVEAEIAMVWVRCRDGFDPDRGVAFDTYFSRSCQHHLTSLCQRYGDRAMDSAIKLDHPMRADSGEDGGYMEILDHSQRSPEQNAIISEVIERARHTDPVLVRMLELCAEGDQDLDAEIEAAHAQVEFAQQQGVDMPAAPTTMTPKLLVKAFDFNWRGRETVVNSIERLANRVG